jgi:hypothetical protein
VAAGPVAPLAPPVQAPVPVPLHPLPPPPIWVPIVPPPTTTAPPTTTTTVAMRPPRNPCPPANTWRHTNLGEYYLRYFFDSFCCAMNPTLPYVGPMAVKGLLFMPSKLGLKFILMQQCGAWPYLAHCRRQGHSAGPSWLIYGELVRQGHQAYIWLIQGRRKSLQLVFLARKTSPLAQHTWLIQGERPGYPAHSWLVQA